MYAIQCLPWWPHPNGFAGGTITRWSCAFDWARHLVLVSVLVSEMHSDRPDLMECSFAERAALKLIIARHPEYLLEISCVGIVH